MGGIGAPGQEGNPNALRIMTSPKDMREVEAEDRGRVQGLAIYMTLEHVK